MISAPIIDTLFSFVLLFMWMMLFYHAKMAVSGYSYFKTLEKTGELLMGSIQDLPGISVIVPARNEEKVLDATLDAILDLSYPRDRIEIIVVNDGSTDKTKEVLDAYAEKFRRIKPVHVPPKEVSRGKADTLNEGLQHCQYDYIVVFDADNLPEQMSLQYLVRMLLTNNNLAAVCGKVRTYNRNKNLLTRFVNIEFIAHQWLLQAGRWKSHEIALIPGTNYVIRKDALEKAGSWDPKALAEDSELSFRLFGLGYKIAFFPLSVTWEQEPETWSVWRKQRVRWIQGNKYIVKTYLFGERGKKGNFYNFIYMFLIYYLLVFAIIFSDVIFLLGLFNVIHLHMTGPLIFLWLFAFSIFCIEIMIALTFEIGESSWSNFGLIMLMYFTYCQQWLYVAVRSFLERKKESEKTVWEKTERF